MKYTIEELKDIYRCLYENNEVAADEEYLEYFEGEYSPSRLDECDTVEAVKGELCHLVEEILNDTGDEELTREWLSEAGADDSLLALCGFEVVEDEKGELDDDERDLFGNGGTVDELIEEATERSEVLQGQEERAKGRDGLSFGRQ